MLQFLSKTNRQTLPPPILLRSWILHHASITVKHLQIQRITRKNYVTRFNSFKKPGNVSTY